MFRDCRSLLAMLALACAVVPAMASSSQPLPASVGGAPPAQQGLLQPAPEFAGISQWLNSPPLTMRGLRGKVVLIDFWAYSCINCLRTLPYVTRWYDTYRDKGFVVVGVHTPEFDFEHDAANVERAIKHFNIHYPVAMDNNAETWKAWNNHYWPAEYLVNQQGEVVARHFGEGAYSAMENAIRSLLGLPPVPAVTDAAYANLARVKTPEMEFGSAFRMHFLANPAGDPAQINDYRGTGSVPPNKYVLQGRWRIDSMHAMLAGGKGAIRLHFHAGKVFMVASSPSPVTLTITVDGKPQPPVTVQESGMYTLFKSDDYSDHEIVIDVPKSGFQAYSFTFG